MNVAPKFAGNNQGVLTDDLEQYISDATETDPSFKAALEDAEDLQRLMDCLLSLRRDQEISQSEIARRMGVRQPTVSEFEKATSDPKLSTLQRYARAIDARVRVMVAISSRSGWSSPSTTAYARGRSTPPISAMRVRNARQLVPAWEAAVNARPVIESIA